MLPVLSRPAQKTTEEAFRLFLVPKITMNTSIRLGCRKNCLSGDCDSSGLKFEIMRPLNPVSMLKGCLEPLQPRRAEEPFMKPTRAIKYGGKRDSCRQGCLDSDGSPVAKFGISCRCVNRAVQTKGTALWAAWTGMPLQSAVPPTPPSFFLTTSFEERNLKKKAEEAARSRSWQILSDIAKINLLKYVEPKYQSEATVVQKEFSCGPESSYTLQITDKWACSIFNTESGLFHQARRCGHIIDLQAIVNRTGQRPSVALMEMEFRRSFNEIICLHLREHMRGFGFNFDSNGFGVLRNECRSLIPYVGAPSRTE
ncbi:hypothetical protein C8J57DRAFT_1226204 [Mycena rebaudengoi]|nr:hypothetical protein C8J57DRAFT_1226204 [Mycena rebaudengoi]